MEAKYPLVDSPMTSTTPPEINMAETDVLMDVLRRFESIKLRFSLELKVEQREALNSLLDGSDVLAVLPTGYGKSLIFQLLVLVGKEERRRPAAVLVICPLKSIIDNQIGEAEGLGIRAVAINDVSSDYFRSGLQATTVRIGRECAREKSAGRSLLEEWSLLLPGREPGPLCSRWAKD